MEVRCYRCGKSMPISYRTLSGYVECAHCHGHMAFDEKTFRRIRIVRYSIIFIVSIALVMGLTLGLTDPILVFIITFLVDLMLVIFSSRPVMWLCGKIFGLNYVEDHPEVREKAQKEKERKKKGKGR